MVSAVAATQMGKQFASKPAQKSTQSKSTAAASTTQAGVVAMTAGAASSVAKTLSPSSAPSVDAGSVAVVVVGSVEVSFE